MKSIPLILLTALITYAEVLKIDNHKVSNPISIEPRSKKALVIDFEKMETGKAPIGFTQTYTGKMQGVNWQIVSDNGNKVVEQTAKNKGSSYNLLVMDNPVYENFSMSVKIKSVSGEEDQGGGLMWRYVDNNNYYVARFNPLENNFRLYHIVDGTRKQIESVSAEIKAGEWFTLGITMKGNKITCSLNGKKVIETTDDTFSKEGKVGLWTKADAVTWFDDLTIK